MKLHQNTGKYFFTGQTLEEVPTVVVEFPFMETFKTQLDTVLGNLL